MNKCKPLTKTIFDLRGTVPVDHPQDFEAIRGAVRRKHAKTVAEPKDADINDDFLIG